MSPLSVVVIAPSVTVKVVSGIGTPSSFVGTWIVPPEPPFGTSREPVSPFEALQAIEMSSVAGWSSETVKLAVCPSTIAAPLPIVTVDGVPIRAPGGTAADESEQQCQCKHAREREPCAEPERHSHERLLPYPRFHAPVDPEYPPTTRHIVHPISPRREARFFALFVFLRELYSLLVAVSTRGEACRTALRLVGLERGMLGEERAVTERLGESLRGRGFAARLFVVVAVALAPAVLMTHAARADDGTTAPATTSDSTGSSTSGSTDTGSTSSTSSDPSATDTTTAPDPTSSGSSDPQSTAPDPGTTTTGDGSSGDGTSTGTTGTSSDPTSTDCTTTSGDATSTGVTEDTACAPASSTGSTDGSTDASGTTPPATTTDDSTPPVVATPPESTTQPAPATVAASSPPSQTITLTLTTAPTTPTPLATTTADETPHSDASVSVPVIATPHVRVLAHKAVAHHRLVHLRAALTARARIAARAPLVPVHNTQVRIVSPSTTVLSAAAAQTADYVRIVAPAEPTTGRDSTSSPKKLFVPPRTPVSPPNGPNSPSSVFGSLLGGGGGGAVLVFAALTGLLVLVRPRISTRCKELVGTPLAYRRALSLECPG